MATQEKVGIIMVQVMFTGTVMTESTVTVMIAFTATVMMITPMITTMTTSAIQATLITSITM